MSIYCFDLDQTLDCSAPLRAMVKALRADNNRVVVCTGNPHAVSVLSSLGVVVDAVKVIAPPHSVNKAKYLKTLGPPDSVILIDNSAQNTNTAPCETLRFAPAPTATPQRSKRTGTGIYLDHLDLDLQRMRVKT